MVLPKSLVGPEQRMSPLSFRGITRPGTQHSLGQKKCVLGGPSEEGSDMDLAREVGA